MGAVRSGIDICLEFRVGGSLSLSDSSAATHAES